MNQHNPEMLKCSMHYFCYGRDKALKSQRGPLVKQELQPFQSTRFFRDSLYMYLVFVCSVLFIIVSSFVLFLFAIVLYNLLSYDFWLSLWYLQTFFYTNTFIL